MTDQKKIQGHFKNVDLLIHGGSYVGLSLALAVKRACPALQVMIIDKSDVNLWDDDERSFALTAAAIRMLTELNCWQKIAEKAQPISEMIITDSRNSDPIRPVFLTFSGEVENNEPFAFMIETKFLVKALFEEAKSCGVLLHYQESITDFLYEKSHITATVKTYHKNNNPEHTTRKIQTKLLVAADGVKSQLRDKAGIKTIHWGYNQIGIVCTIAHERPHNGRAEEHFLPAGPFAVLPLLGNRSSLVWNENKATAERLLKADDFIFEAEIEERFGHHLGALKVVSKRHGFPFGLTLARDFIKPRFALMGDSAHAIHPISGQGLNLGLRDSALLAEIIVNQARLGLDIADYNALKAYERGRRFETLRMGITTDVLNRLFSNDNGTLRILRDLGLGVVDRLPWLKDYLITEAAGLNKNSPKLLLGKSL